MGEDRLDAWIGRREAVDDIVTAAPISGLSATLDRDDPAPALGDELPPPRMWVGGRLTFQRPLRVGEAIRRLSTIRTVERKMGQSGPRVFICVRHHIVRPAARWPGSITSSTARFNWCNRSKRSVCLDLMADDGRRVLRGLVARADVAIRNLAPGAIKRMGFELRRLVEEYPRFNSNVGRSETRAALIEIIESSFAARGPQAVVARLDSAGVANANVNTMSDFWRHPQLHARNRWREVATSNGSFPALRSPGVPEGLAP